MSTALLIARCALAAVFLAAAVSKLADRRRFRLALGGFGATVPLIGPLAWGLPIVELMLAALLLPAGTAQGAAIGAMALLAGFSLAGTRPRHGAEADCGCFGRRSSAGIQATVLRNAGLIALAAPVAVLV